MARLTINHERVTVCDGCNARMSDPLGWQMENRLHYCPKCAIIFADKLELEREFAEVERKAMAKRVKAIEAYEKVMSERMKG